MGIGGIGIWQLLIILLIIFMLFGTKKLKTLGSDLGGAIKGFKKAMNSEDDKPIGTDSAMNANKVEHRTEDKTPKA